MNLPLLTSIPIIAGTLGQFADSWTTFDAFYVLKLPGVVEGDKSATWITKNKYLCLLFKPILFAACGTGLILAGPHTNGGGYALATVLGIVAAFVGFMTARDNAKINGRWF